MHQNAFGLQSLPFLISTHIIIDSEDKEGVNSSIKRLLEEKDEKKLKRLTSANLSFSKELVSVWLKRTALFFLKDLDIYIKDDQVALVKESLQEFKKQKRYPKLAKNIFSIENNVSRATFLFFCTLHHCKYLPATL